MASTEERVGQPLSSTLSMLSWPSPCTLLKNRTIVRRYTSWKAKGDLCAHFVTGTRLRRKSQPFGLRPRGKCCCSMWLGRPKSVPIKVVCGRPVNRCRRHSRRVCPRVRCDFVVLVWLGFTPAWNQGSHTVWSQQRRAIRHRNSRMH